MNEREVGVVLGNLRFLDEEMVRLYEGVFPKVHDPGKAEKLRHFQEDHRRHITELDDIARRENIRFLQPTAGLRELLDDRREAIGWARDEAEMYRELLIAEQFDAFAYGQPTEMQMQPLELMQIVGKHHDDEVRHAMFCRQQVEEHTQAPVSR